MNSHEPRSFEPKNVLAAISQLDIGGDGSYVDEICSGGECLVFKVSFIDRASVAVRVRHPTVHNSPDATIAIAMVQMEMHTIQTLETKGFSWAPRCLGASLTFDNPIKHPFLVLTWVDGSPMPWDGDFPPRPLRNALLSQIASIQMSLITCTLENRSVTATDYFERRMRNTRTRVIEGKLPALSEQDCIDQKGLLDGVLGQDRDNTLFAMDHGDIKPGNIIVDEEYNIKCIIDWGFAAMVPIAKAAALPRFLGPDDSVGSAPCPAVLKDRKAYIGSLSSHTSQAALSMLRWQDVDDVDFRTLYLESLFSKGVHAFMAEIGWKLPYCKFVGTPEGYGALDESLPKGW